MHSEETPSSVVCECPGRCTGRGGMKVGRESKSISTEKGQGGDTSGVSPPTVMLVAVEDLGSVQEEEGVGDDDKPIALPAESSEEGSQTNKSAVDQSDDVSLSENETKNSPPVDVSTVENATVIDLSCCVCASTENIRVCGGCEATMYCSRKCQVNHQDHHAPWYATIASLEKLELDKIYGKKKARQSMGDENYVERS